MPHFTLILNASPVGNGRVARAAEAVAAACRARGGEVVEVNVTKLKVAPCKGCMRCRTTGKCILKDDAATISDYIKRCDTLVVAAPTYFSNMPGELKLLFDRIVPTFFKDAEPGHFPTPLHRGKRFGVITACNTPFPFNILLGESSVMVKAVRKVMRYSGFKCVDNIQMAYGKAVNVDRCARMAKRLYAE
jgi:putative NADPH-quinone reductase